MNKQSADTYALALVMELAKSSEGGFASAISGSADGYAASLASFIAKLSSNLQADIHEHVDLPLVQKLIKNGSGQ